MKQTRILDGIGRALALACLAAGVLPAQAALLSSESFNVGAGGYTTGDVAGQASTDAFYSGGWFKGDPTHDVQIVGTGLSYNGLLSSGGALATGAVGRGGRNLATPWDNNTVGTYYISFLANFGVGGTHHRVVEAWNAPSLAGADGTRSLQLGYSTFTGLGTTLSLSINNGSDGVDESDFDNNVELAADGTTHLFVLRYDLANTAGGDTVYGYMDPADLSFEPGSANVLMTGFDFGLAAFGSVVNFVFDGTPTGTIDEIRFGDTWNDVLPVPEPSSLALLVLGGVGLVAARRKQA
ncbi:MAG TPA: PEP-CTERM sorting domain-containing protein [Verrucomicrobiae bacterium]|nr:PEP-CTERM sorting domain-containing protein [Verrucomicrobiae bacterium]